MVYKFYGGQGSRHGNKFGPKKLHSSVLCKKSRNLSHVQWGFRGLVNFNTLSEILREPRELPWQPIWTKNKQK